MWNLLYLSLVDLFPFFCLFVFFGVFLVWFFCYGISFLSGMWSGANSSAGCVCLHLSLRLGLRLGLPERRFSSFHPCILAYAAEQHDKQTPPVQVQGLMCGAGDWGVYCAACWVWVGERCFFRGFERRQAYLFNVPPSVSLPKCAFFWASVKFNECWVLSDTCSWVLRGWWYFKFFCVNLLFFQET